MNSIIESLGRYLQANLSKPSQQLVVAYSGGVDSLVLLHGLAQLRARFDFNLSAIHIHHGLSANADQWQAHCQHTCEGLGVEFVSAKVSLPSLPRTSLEAQARSARYEALQSMAGANSWIVLGQHQDDQLETFLLQLKRGAGPKGLASMPMSWQGQHKPVSFHRPLLNVSQQQIHDYAAEHNLKWCEDESNQDVQFERNFLRQQIIPSLKQRWPNLAQTVARSAALCAQQERLLDEVCEDKLQGIQSNDGSLFISGLLLLSEAWQHQVVRFWLGQQAIPMPSQGVMHKLMPEVLLAADDAQPILQWQDWQFRRFDQQLYVIEAPSEPIAQWHAEFALSDIDTLDLPVALGRLYIAEQAVESCLAVTKGTPVLIKIGGFSTRFKPTGEPYSKPLKQWFKLWRIPPWVRANCIQVFQQQELLGICLAGKWLKAESAAQSPHVYLDYSRT